MVTDNLAVIPDINHIEGMQPVLVVDVYAVRAIFQNENDTGRRVLTGRNNRVQTERRFFNIRMVLDIFQQVQTELVEPQIHNGNAGGHILNINNLVLQALQLCFSVFKVGLFVIAEQVIVTRGGHIHDFHTGFNSGFQVDIIVKGHIRPEIHKLNDLVAASDTVNTPEALNDTNRIPVNVVVDEIVAVLQVLTFRNAVGGNQNVDFRIVAGHQQLFVLGYRREAGQNRV